MLARLALLISCLALSLYASFDFSDDTLSDRLNDIHLTDTSDILLDFSVEYTLPNYTKVQCSQVDEKPGVEYRTCKVNDICFSLEPFGLLGLTGSGSSQPEINLSGPVNYFPFRLSFEEKNVDHDLGNIPVIYIKNPTILMSRYLPENIFHRLHDDILPMVQLIASNEELRKAHRCILFIDRSNLFNGLDIFQLLGAALKPENLLKISQKLPNKPKTVCFRNGFAGFPRKTLWFQQGLKRRLPGPETLFSPKVIGRNILTTTNWIKRQYQSSTYENANLNELYTHILQESALPDASPGISVISRSRYRRIINESELVSTLEKEFPAINVSLLNEDMDSFSKIVNVASESFAMIGVHGALLGVAMFMPRDAMIFEIFPFSVDSDNAGHYKSLSNLPDLNFHYRSMMSRVVSDIDEATLFRLTPSYQYGVKKASRTPIFHCCFNMFWRYKMVQDVEADIPLIIQGIKEMLLEASRTK